MTHLYVALLLLLAIAVGCWGVYSFNKVTTTFWYWNEGHEHNTFWLFSTIGSAFVVLSIAPLTTSLFK